MLANGRVLVAGGTTAAGTSWATAELYDPATGTWTLAQLDALDRLDGRSVSDFARAVERPEGGFRGGLWDDGHDVEYTFYGLGVLGLFATA